MKAGHDIFDIKIEVKCVFSEPHKAIGWQRGLKKSILRPQFSSMIGAYCTKYVLGYKQKMIYAIAISLFMRVANSDLKWKNTSKIYNRIYVTCLCFQDIVKYTIHQRKLFNTEIGSRLTGKRVVRNHAVYNNNLHWKQINFD